MMQTKFRELSKTRSRLLVEGPDAKRFLHGMVTNDILGLKEGQGCHAAMLTVKGKLLGDFLVHQLSETSLLLSMEGQVKEAIFGALERHLIMDDASVRDIGLDLGQLGVYGRNADENIRQLFPKIAAQLDLPPGHFIETKVAEEPIHIVATKELGIPGYFLLGSEQILFKLKEALLRQGVAEMPESEAENLRIEAGVPKYGLDMDEERLPLEANLDDTISFQKGCYLGQEVIVRVTSRGHINRKLMGIYFPDIKILPPPGSNLFHETRENAGTIMSGVSSPRFGTIALAYVHRSLWEPGTRLFVTERGTLPDETTPVGIVQSLPFTSPNS